MKKILAFSVLVVMLASVGVPWVYGNARRHSGFDVNTQYSYIEIPPGIMLCEQDSTGGLRCIDLPPGTVLMLPIPEEAPVDTLRDRT